MKININDIKFWMDAPTAKTETIHLKVSGGQLQSKEMLVKHLEYRDYEKYDIVNLRDGMSISIYNNSNLDIGSITSVDIDPSVEETAKTINKNQEMQGRFTAKTGDMCTDKYSADIVINTSCEHLDKEKLQQWFNNIPKGTMYVMQSNNYTELEEHVNCVNSADELAESVGTNDYDVAELVLPKYTRYMISGVK